MTTSAGSADFIQPVSESFVSGAMSSVGVWKDKVRKDWCYTFKRHAKRHGSRGYKTKSAAVAAREEHRKRLAEEDRLIPVRIRQLTEFRHVASLYLDEAKRRFVEKTYKQKAFIIREFLRMVGNKPVDEYNPNEISQYLLSRPSNHNFNAHRKDLSAVFNYAKTGLGLIEKNPVSSIAKLPHSPERKYVPPEADVLKIILAAGKPEQAFILTILLTGARVDEIQRLTWSDVNFDRRTITRWTRKRKGGNYAPITTRMTGELGAIMWWLFNNRTDDNELVFANPKTGQKYVRRYKMIKGLCRRAGVEKPFTFHALRHFVASILADKKKISKKSIGEMLGHMNLSTTEIYLHSLSEGAAAASEALEDMFGGTLGSTFEQKKALVAPLDGTDHVEDA